MKRTGANLLVESLKKEGVEVIFGYPGGAILPVYDELYRQEEIQHVLTVHEQGAAHAADGYARASGRVGVCLATSGPGATNLITGLATAHMDSVPIVAITGQVSTGLMGKDSFQEVDITGMTLSISKHSFVVREVARIPQLVHEAFRIAASGRPGVVILDIPRDMQTQEVEEEEVHPCFATPPRSVNWPEAGLEAAAKALAAAKRPVVQVGGGAVRAGAASQVRELARHLDAPVVSTLMGLGVMPGDDSRFLGLTGMHGHKAANLAVHHADLVLAIGCRFSDRFVTAKAEFIKGKTIVQLDIDPAEIGKNIPSHVGLTGNVGLLAQDLLEKVPKAERTDWWRQIQDWRANGKEKDEVLLDGPWIMKFLSAQTQDQRTVFVTDVGQHQMWAAQHLTLRQPRTWLTSGGFGTMGFGMPAALGAQTACPEARVIHICGDGSFRMTGMELHTIASTQAPVISIVLDNGSLGMVRQWQELFFGGRCSSSILKEFDYVGMANALGVEGAVAQNRAEFTASFQRAWQERKPFVLVAKVESQQVRPMLKPGGQLNEFIESM